MSVICYVTIKFQKKEADITVTTGMLIFFTLFKCLSRFFDVQQLTARTINDRLILI